MRPDQPSWQPAADDGLTAFSSIIDRLYSGATEPSLWPAILADVAAWIDAPKAVLVTPLHTPDQGGFQFEHGFPPMIFDLWRTRYSGDDIWTRAGVERKFFVSGNIAIGDELVPQARLLESRWYREFLSRAQIAQLLTSIVFGMESAVTRPVVCSFFRSLDDAPFGPAERERLALLVPHLSRALGVMQRLREAELHAAAGSTALDRLPHAVLMLGPGGDVLFANAAANRILQRGDGIALSSPDHTLRVHGRGVQQAVDVAILATLTHAEPAAHFSRAVQIPRSDGRAPYLLQFSRLPAASSLWHSGMAPAALVFVTDTAAPPRVEPQLLREAYGLSPAEARVAVAHAHSASVAEAAEALALSANTVKTHLKQIYAKLHVASRADFIRLLLGLSVA